MEQPIEEGHNDWVDWLKFPLLEKGVLQIAIHQNYDIESCQNRSPMSNRQLCV